jgi:hypothetical protein
VPLLTVYAAAIVSSSACQSGRQYTTWPTKKMLSDMLISSNGILYLLRQLKFSHFPIEAFVNKQQMVL